MSFWSSYKDALNPKQDIKSIFIRPSGRYASLDGARALTILLLILFHVLFGAVRLMDRKGSSDAFIQSFPEWLNWVWHAQGSDPLFVVCGLLVSFSLFKEYERDKGINLMTFYQRRLTRIGPLFLLAILIYLPTDSDNIKYVWSNLFFASNFFESQRTIIPVGWSLDLQMQFYLLLPLFYIYIFYKTPYKISFLVFLIVASSLWRLWVLYQHPSLYERPFYDVYTDKDHARMLAQTLYYDLDMRIGGFIMGMLIAALHFYHAESITRFLQKHVVVNFFVLLTALGLIYISVSVPFHNKHAEYYQHFEPWVNFIFLGLTRYAYSLGIAILIFLVMVPSGASKIFERFFRAKIFYPFAQLIFPMYLFHFPFIIIAAACVYMTTDRELIVTIEVWQVFAIYALTLLFSMIFSLLAHVYIEKPCIILMDRKMERKKLQAYGEASS